MTPEQKRIAIAKACGLEVLEKANPDDSDAWNRGYFTPSAAKERARAWPHSAVVRVIPNYLVSLDAMHEAEKVLTDEQWDTYGIHLGYYDKHPPAGAGVKAQMHLTAAERAEAFLKTILK